MNAYGLSELAPISMTSYGDTEEHIANTVGKPVDGIEIRIYDLASGTDCVTGDGKSGEILVRGQSMMACYYKRDIDDQSVDDEDWLHTGDLGFLDESGYLHIVGRSNELIIRSGENIIPNEIASAIADFDNVSDVKVMGVPDDFYGEVPAACIVLQDRNSWNPDALLNFLEGKLAKFKIPSYMEVFEEFPTLSNGKVDMLGLKRILLERIKETAESA